MTAPRLLASDVPTAAPKGDGRKTYQAAPVPPATGRVAARPLLSDELLSYRLHSIVPSNRRGQHPVTVSQVTRWVCIP